MSVITGNLQQQYGITFEVVSGGNSVNYRWFVSTPEVGLVNNLRIGEAILLGCDTLTRERIPSLYTDAFTLVAEVVELKTKSSRPYGEITQDAFGRVPVFEGKGNMERVILALGRQDIDGSAIKPRIKADVLGASSDHLILDVNGLGLEVGAKVRSDVGYSALLRAMTSPYVENVYLPQSHLTARCLPRVDNLLACAAHPYVVKQGERSASFDLPERVDSILFAQHMPYDHQQLPADGHNGFVRMLSPYQALIFPLPICICSQCSPGGFYQDPTHFLATALCDASLAEGFATFMQIKVNYIGLKIKVKFTGQFSLPGESRCRLPQIYRLRCSGLFRHRVSSFNNGSWFRGV